MINEHRLRPLNRHSVRPDGAFVLYWMTAARRLNWNFGLDRALSVANELGKPLLILEALRVDYPWASARHHRFMMDGMVEHARALEGAHTRFLAALERERSRW